MTGLLNQSLFSIAGNEYTSKNLLWRVLVFLNVAVGLFFGIAVGESVHNGPLTLNSLTIIIPLALLSAGFSSFFKSRIARTVSVGFGMAVAIGPVLYAMLSIPEMAQTYAASPDWSFLKIITMTFTPVYAITISVSAWQMSSDVSKGGVR